MGFGREVQSLLGQAAIPVVHLALGCATGMALAAGGILHEALRKDLAKLSLWLFVPSLTFVKLGASVNIQRLLDWWYLPVNVLLNLMMGSLVGLLVARLCRIRDPMLLRLVVCAVGCGNVGNLPMVVITAVCHAESARDRFGEHCLDRGVSYVVLGMWAAQTVQFSVMNRILASTEHDFVPLDDAACKATSARETTVVDVVARDTEVGNGSGEREEVQDADITMEKSSPSLQGQGEEEQLARATKAHTVCRSAARFNDWVPPPVLASWLAVGVGACAPLKHLFFGAHAPLGAVRDVMGYFGGGFVASALLILGGNLSQGPGEAAVRMGKWTLACVVFARLVIMPLLGWCVVSLVARSGVIPKDPLFLFVSVLQQGTPTAINMSMLCTLHGHSVAEISGILFWQYLLALPSLGLTLLLAFSIA